MGKEKVTTISISNCPVEWVDKVNARLKQVAKERNWPKTTLVSYVKWLIENDLTRGTNEEAEKRSRKK